MWLQHDAGLLDLRFLFSRNDLEQSAPSFGSNGLQHNVVVQSTESLMSGKCLRVS